MSGRERIIRRYLTALTVAAALSLSAAVAADTLRAGAARVDITPPPSMLPAQSVFKLASVHDPLYVRVLLLDNGQDKVVLVSMDSLLLLQTDALIGSVANELSIPRDRVLISATHSHNAPFFGLPGAYTDLVSQRVLDAVRQANARVKPARIGYRTGKAYVNVNRDEKVGDSYTIGYVPEGPSDKTVAVLTVSDTAGKPMAVYANYPVHAVVMFGSRTQGESEISGDLPGATSRYVEERLGNDVVALWTSGAAGDQNPIYTAAYWAPDGSLKDSGPGGWTLMDAQARRLGEEIVRVVGNTDATSGSAKFQVVTDTLTCPGQKPAEEGAPLVPSKTIGAAATVAVVDDAPVEIPLTLMTIGDIALAGVAGELYTEIGMAIKAQSPFDHTMVVTNLPDGVGYIPTDRAYAMPAEKARTARMKPGCADAGIPATFKAMASEILSHGKAEE